MNRLNALALVAILSTGCASTDESDVWCSPSTGQCWTQQEMEDGYRADAARARLNHSGVEELHTGPYTGPMPTDTTNGRDIIIP